MTHCNTGTFQTDKTDRLPCVEWLQKDIAKTHLVVDSSNWCPIRINAHRLNVSIRLRNLWDDNITTAILQNVQEVVKGAAQFCVCCSIRTYADVDGVRILTSRKRANGRLGMKVPVISDFRRSNGLLGNIRENSGISTISQMDAITTADGLNKSWILCVKTPNNNKWF